MTRVKNAIGSSTVSPNPPAPYKSWLDYWEGESNTRLRAIYFCPACETITSRANVFGCHVQKVGFTSDKSWYIIPLCNSCNRRTDNFDINDILLVPVPSNL